MPLHNLLKNPSRRNFVGRGAALIAAAPLAGCLNTAELERPVQFTHGVASGDPLSDRVMLWTRVRGLDPNDNADVKLQWEVAGDAGFAQLVASGEATATASSDFTVKVDAGGLQAGRRYHYRFRAHGLLSPVGRCRTLPTGGVSEARFAV
ncbi:MAG: alkaline phosphatase D family protein, partial [Inhella sp.]